MLDLSPGQLLASLRHTSGTGAETVGTGRLGLTGAGAASLLPAFVAALLNATSWRGCGVGAAVSRRSISVVRQFLMQPASQASRFWGGRSMQPNTIRLR